MRPYVSLHPSHKSRANVKVRKLGSRLGAGEVGRDKFVPADCNLLIQWGFRPTICLMSAIAEGIPYIIVDLGYFDETRGARYSVSLNGFHGLALRDPKVLDRPPRPAPAIHDWREEGSKIVVCGQMPGDQSLRGQDSEAWMGRTASACSEQWSMPVLKRPHPKMLNVWEPPLEALSFAFEDCHVFVTWTSTAAVQSVLAGVPTVAMHPGTMARPMAANSLTRLTPPGREAWVHEVSWREWNWQDEADLDRLAEYVIEMLPLMRKSPLDNPRTVL